MANSLRYNQETGQFTNAVEVSGRKLKVGLYKSKSNVQVDAGTTAMVTITPTPGYIGRLCSLSLSAPAVVGSTGNHLFFTQIGDYDAYSTNFCIQNISAAGTSALMISGSTLADGYKGVVFDGTHPLNIAYLAPGTVPQTGYRVYMVVWEEEAIV